MKKVKIPLPSRENVQNIPLADVGENYQRIVFDDDGNSFKTDFLNAEEQEQLINDLSYAQANLVYEERIPEITEIVNQSVLDNQLPLPALWSESSSFHSLSSPFNNWNFERYNPDNIVTKISSTTFELTPGYIYKVSAMLTSQSDDNDVTGLVWRLLVNEQSPTSPAVTFSPSGNLGILYQMDQSGSSSYNSSSSSSVESTHFVTVPLGYTTRCQVQIVYMSPGTSKTHGDSKILFEVVKKI
jgi:hypothetical protein